ncbi:MAG TPA: PilX N-terminal domain-containing pilus assembly protein [Candidatus Sulfotelmatobacter sp.]
MGKAKKERGFTLIAALLLTILLSGIAVGLLYSVGNEARMGGNDLEGDLAYYGAEAGMENLTAQLSQLYQTSQTPNAAAITALASASNYPTAVSGSNISNMNYVETITWPNSDAAGNPTGTWDIVGSGPDQGMVATLIPFNLQVTATRQGGAGQVAANSALAASGAAVNLSRTVEVALLPAFEFGVFCDGDCDYFAGPNFNFGGRVHTNGNLFLASGGSNLTFTDKIAAVGHVVLDQLENGWPTSNQYGGQVWVPTAAGGCPAAPTPGPGSSGLCSQLTAGSWVGGFPSYTGATNSSPKWKVTSTPFNGFIVNGSNGATKLQLPFVESSPVGAIDIVRRPAPGDTQLLSNSRLYNKAQIRVLLADSITDLHPERGAGVLDADDVQLTPGTPVTTNSWGKMYFAQAQSATGSWVAPASCNLLAAWPLHGQVTVPVGKCQSVWLRVEYLDNGNPGVWHGVTQEWLKYGFGRGYNMPPTAPYVVAGANPACPVSTLALPAAPAGQCYNPISPAILILQQIRSDLPNNNGATGAATQNNWLPINFYDAREGEPRDTRPGGDPDTACSPAGVMNTVEIDVGNLWLWLQASGPYAGGHGPSVNSINNNGYILYFSDHRGMLPDTQPIVPFYNNLSGMSGLNDTVNGTSPTGIPDGALEPATYYTYSPENVAGKAPAFLDTWGQTFLGDGFGISGAARRQPYYISGTTAGIAGCQTIAEWNMVTGPRHVLRLVDGGMDATGTSYLPHPIAPATFGNGFTVASEEPVYVLGNYNSGPSDPFWPSGGNPTTPHSAAAIIADAVTLLSNPPTTVTPSGWTDHGSLANPGLMGNRPGNTSYYRMAIAAGKSVPFPEPAWAIAAGLKDFGTDGGMHNFLRYLENRGANGATVNYAGSLISMYYSQYATGVFKCCNAVYGAPTRNYFFDTQFLNPNNLPPGTPMFQDVVSLSYHQSFTPQ